MTVHTLTLPKEIKTRAPQSTRVLALVREAIMLGLEPMPWDRKTAKKHIRVRLNDEDRALVLDYMQKRGYKKKLASVLAQLAYAAWKERQKARIRQAEQESELLSDPFAGRSEQRRFYTQIKDALGRSPTGILLAEGGTGLGKSRVLAMLAMEQAKEKDSPVVIAAPTIQVMAQIANEFPEGADVAALLGKSQFVDPVKLELWLSVEDVPSDEIERAREWLRKGAPIVGENGYGTTFAKTGSNLAYLFDDLVTLCPSLAGADVCVDESTDEDSPALAVYQTLRERALSSSIIVCTHAGLVIDARLKHMGYGGLLPETPPVLLIDEAHLLSSAAESAHSSSLSFIVLLNVLIGLRKNKVRGAKTAAEVCQSFIDMLRGTFPQSGPIDPAAASDKIPKDLLRRLKALKTAGMSRQQQGVLSRAIHLLSAFLRRDYTLQVQYSRIRRWPSLMAGPKSLSFFFKNFWESAKAAVLVSGTIYLPGRTALEGLNSHYMALLLNLPKARTIPIAPVHPKWGTAYTIHTPDPSEWEDFTPPSESSAANTDQYDEALSRWCVVVAGKIQHIAETAKGGTLVLFGGYELLERVAEELAATQVMGRLVTQSRDEGFAVAKARFLELATQEARPVWLATGPAWTGLDLSDSSKPASEDFLLTDLVIPRLPFGMEHTTVHEHRKEVHGFLIEVYRTAFLFRQGIGRLIRREGVSGRRLWVLDARIWKEDAAWYFRYFQQFLIR